MSSFFMAKQILPQELSLIQRCRTLSLNTAYSIPQPIFEQEILERCMSPVSPVFHTVVTVRIGLKTQSEWEHPFHNTRC